MVLGTLGAIAMVRVRSFKGRTLFSGLISAPLVMPEVITGLALLLTFVTLERLIGWPSQRGMLTVIIAHTTLSMAYVYIIVRSRLQDFNYSLEEAALDLGAKPFTVLQELPFLLLLQLLFLGGCFLFALSLDDVVIASFCLAGFNDTAFTDFSNVRLGITPEINALATLIVGIVSISVTIVGVIMLRQQRKDNSVNRIPIVLQVYLH